MSLRRGSSAPNLEATPTLTQGAPAVLWSVASEQPFRRFGSRFAEDIPKLQANGLLYYHAWAFASVRQAGAAFELAAANLRWQAGFDHPGLVAVADCFEAISQTTRRSFSKAPERLIPAGHLTLP